MTTMEDRQNIFQIKARRCLRCGGILTSKEGLETGYGSCCLRKIQEEAAERRMMEAQISMFQEEESDHETADEAAGADDRCAV